jgi:hypothetical protein
MKQKLKMNLANKGESFSAIQESDLVAHKEL